MSRETKDKFFKELMENAYEKIYMFVCRGREKEFAEDVVQETFYEAYRKLDMLMEHPNQMGWLYQTAKNKIMKLGAKRGEFYPLNEEYNSLKGKETNKSSSGYEEVELAETLKTSVTELEYEMLRDYYVNGYSSEEVAEKYGVDKGGIRMRMTRLKKKLKEEIIVNWIIVIVCVWRFLWLIMTEI